MGRAWLDKGLNYGIALDSILDTKTNPVCFWKSLANPPTPSPGGGLCSTNAFWLSYRYTNVQYLKLHNHLFLFFPSLHASKHERIIYGNI